MENLKSNETIIKFIIRRNKFVVDPTTLSMLGFSSGDYFFDKRIGAEGLLTIGVFFDKNIDIFWDPFFYSSLSDAQKKATARIVRKIYVKNLGELINILEKTTGKKFKI